MADTNKRGGKAGTPSHEIPAQPAGGRGPLSLPLPSMGGAGGRSGTGQATPHHGMDDGSGQDMADSPVDPDSLPPLPLPGPDHQSGGTRLDRAQHDEERKQRDRGAGVGRSPRGGADPAPGAPATRNGA
jgi:hypothetical protein